jgi:hypothetical protein
MKTFSLQQNIGSAKYVINFSDGQKVNKDGSPFSDIRIFSNKKKRDKFISKLKQDQYTLTH